MDSEIGSSHQIAANSEVGESLILRWTRETTQHDIVDGIVRNQVVNCPLILDTHRLLNQSAILESIGVCQRASKFFFLLFAPFSRFVDD